MEENLCCSGDSWQVSKTKNNGKILLPFEDDFEQKEEKEVLNERLEDIQPRYQDIFDSDDENFHKDFFGGFGRPKSSGTIPKSRRFLSSNMSDPCLLSSSQNEMLLNPSPENPSTDDHSTNTSQMNSLDSGIPDECSSGKGTVCSFLKSIFF